MTLTGDNRILLGRGLMLNPKSFPQAPLASLAAKDPAMPGTYRVDKPEEAIYLAGTVCNLGLPGARIYGHWIVDVLPRLYKTLGHGLVIDHYVMGETRKPWQNDILKAVGVAEDKFLFWDARQYRLEAERLVVPTFARISSELHEEFMDVHIFLREKHAASELGSPATDKLFIARAEGGNRQLANRDAVEAVFADHGFEIFRPELWPFVEQIKKLARAAVVAGECGSGMHNTVFCRPGTRVGVLQSSANLSFLQGQIALHAQHDLYYLIGMPIDPKEAYLKSSWRVDIADAHRFIAMLS
ncbi:glycosyltransferase family 61 protein [Methylomagnum ishizawai]|uniref:glycosyltransferase family 61 protein n=1 Tax=Methylomagnum ishizawai TaxID=1760988 RepID=UPI001592C74A|nr:glycosyltransferase 61 family protein [Methylomagnum ishizawai]